MRRIDWRLCFIADSEAAGGREILPLIVDAVEGGATLVQLRGKKWTSRKFLELGVQAVRFLRAEKIPLIINDRLDIALACEADGVHLGQDDLPIHYARKLLGKNRMIGISTSTLEEAEEAEKAGADYVGAGPVFGTLSKKDIGPLLGLEGLRAIRIRVKIPILAIGGLTAGNVGEVISAGADGVAVISAITAADRPKKATAEIFGTIAKTDLRKLGSERRNHED